MVTTLKSVTGISAVFSSDELSDELDDDGDSTESEAIVFTIGKSF